MTKEYEAALEANNQAIKIYRLATAQYYAGLISATEFVAARTALLNAMEAFDEAFVKESKS